MEGAGTGFRGRQGGGHQQSCNNADDLMVCFHLQFKIDIA